MAILLSESHIEAYRQRALRIPRVMSGRSPEETARVNKHIREFIGDVPELLDVGCGDGSLLALMGAPRSVGVGPTEDECRILRARYPEITFTCGTAQNIPVADKSFDTVVCNGVLLLMPSQEDFLLAVSELKRVARRQLFIGEMPYKPESFTQDISSPWRYVQSNLRKSLRHGLSAAKLLAPAAIGQHTFISEPNQLTHCPESSMISLIGVPAEKVGEMVPGRREYLFSFQ